MFTAYFREKRISNFWESINQSLHVSYLVFSWKQPVQNFVKLREFCENSEFVFRENVLNNSIDNSYDYFGIFFATFIMAYLNDFEWTGNDKTEFADAFPFAKYKVPWSWMNHIKVYGQGSERKQFIVIILSTLQTTVPSNRWKIG